MCLVGCKVKQKNYIYPAAVIICKKLFGADDLKKDKENVGNIFGTQSQNARKVTIALLMAFRDFPYKK